MAVDKEEFAAIINAKLNLRDKAMVHSVINEIGPTILEILMDGRELHISDLGRFYTKYVEHMKNPQTLEPLGPMFIPKFTISNVIRSKVKSKRADYFNNEKDHDEKQDI